MYNILFSHAETTCAGYYGYHTPSFMVTHAKSNFHSVHCEWACVCQSVRTKLASLLHMNSGPDLNRTERKKTRKHMFLVCKGYER